MLALSPPQLAKLLSALPSARMPFIWASPGICQWLLPNLPV